METVPQTLPLSKGLEAFELAARVEGRSHKTKVLKLIPSGKDTPTLVLLDIHGRSHNLAPSPWLSVCRMGRRRSSP